MWYTADSGSFDSLDSFLADVLDAAGATLVSDLKSFNRSDLAANDGAGFKAVISYLAGLSSTDLQSLIASLGPSIAYAYSADGVSWSSPTTVLSGTAAAWDACGVSSPSVIRSSSSSYRLWYTGWRYDVAALQQLFVDLDQLDASAIQTLLTDLLIDKDPGAAFSDLKTATASGEDYPGIIFEDVSDLLLASGGDIGYASSSDGINWTKSSAPVLERDSDSNPDAWDIYGVYSPSVVSTDSGYAMWYTGFTVDFTPLTDLLDSSGTDFAALETALSEAPILQIGRAVSTDGAAWTKDSDPVLAQDFGAGSLSAGSWHGVASPSVLVDGSGAYQMWYTDAVCDSSPLIDFVKGDLSFTDMVSASGTVSIYHAVSTDGVAWTSPAAVLTPGSGSDWDDRAVGSPSVLLWGADTLMWYTGLAVPAPADLVKDLLDGETVSAALLAGNARASLGLAVADSGESLVSLTVTPASSTLRKDKTLQYTATGAYSGGSQIDLTALASWQSSAASIADFVDSGTPGLVTGLAYGKASITASFDGVSSDPVALTVKKSSTSGSGGGSVSSPSATPTPTPTPSPETSTTPSLPTMPSLPTVTPTLPSVTATPVPATPAVPTVTPAQPSASSPSASSPAVAVPAQPFNKWLILLIIVVVALVIILLILIIRRRHALH